MTQHAHDFLVVATGLLIFCGIAGLMLTRPASVAHEWPAPLWVQAVASVPLNEWVTVEYSKPRASIYELWCERRASESPIFAALAREMNLGLALGVAA